MWLLLHGFTGSPQSWAPVVTHARLGAPLLVPTLMGHGGDWQGRRLDTLEDEITRIVTLVLGAERPRLVCGYSMGARVALNLLVSHPGLFDAAVLIGVHPGLADEAARIQRRKADSKWIRLLRDEGLAPFVAEWEAQPLFQSQRELPAEARDAQREVRLGHDAEGLARSLEALGLAEMRDVRPELGSLELPIQLVAGSLDFKFCEIARMLAAESDRIDLQIVDGVGHNVVLEAPAQVAAILRRTEETLLG